MRGTKPRLLFVGAFSLGQDGLTGGTYVACKQLLDGGLGALFDIVRMDTSQVTEQSRGLASRLFTGLGRVLRVSALVLGRRIDCALIFATLGPSWFERGLIAMICRMGGVRSLVFSRTGEVNTRIEKNRFMRRFTAAMLGMGVHFIFQGPGLRARFLAVFPAAAAQAHAVMNWIDLGWRQGVAPPPAGDPVTILYVGWLHRWKGVDILMEALARHAGQFRGCRFVLCGDGEERAALEIAAARTGLDIVFRGWVHGEEKKAAFSQAHIMVLPSRIEGMPNTLLEAMSVGRAVVATCVGSVPDLVTDGVEGLLVPTGQPDALAQALLVLVGDPARRQKMGDLGRARIEQSHDLRDAGGRLAALLSPPSLD